MLLNVRHIFLFFCILFFIPQYAGAVSRTNTEDTLMITYPDKNKWVDSIMNSLSLKEKVAQLFMLRANYANEEYLEEVTNLISEYNIGGVTFFGSTPAKQVHQTNLWQSLAKTPLLISIDGEWGVGMRLDSVNAFPFQMTLGAISNDSLIYRMGALIAEQCKRLGIQMNFAPVVDVNVNPRNPVINMRSFGEDPREVANKGLAYMKGMQDHGIIATAKHFPGHGDTEKDSHKTLPMVKHSWARLDSVELLPFRKLIENGLQSVMIAHLYLPFIEPAANTATTLSHKLVQEVLRDSLDFNGLIITDALDMKGVTKYFPPGEIEVRALQAGNDILLLPQDARKGIEAILTNIEQGNIPESIIEEKCRKILQVKYEAGLFHQQLINSNEVISDLNNESTRAINYRVYSEAISLVKNADKTIPVLHPAEKKIATLIIGSDKAHPFEKYIGRYANTDIFRIGKEFSNRERKELLDNLQLYDLVIAGITNTNIRAWDQFGISREVIRLVQEIALKNNVILNLFASPYALDLFDITVNLESILVSYQDNDYTWDISSQIIFGGHAAEGSIPVTASELYPIHTGIRTRQMQLGYANPEVFGITDTEIERIDSIALSGIRKKAYPGCQIVAAKDGKIFYNKTFGHHTYNKKRPTQIEDIYDLASITKIAATTLSIMKLNEEGKIDIDDKIEEYLPYLRGTEKGNIIIRELMAHQSGLQAWIPYYLFTLNEEGQPNPEIYSTTISEDYPIRVAENLYIRKDFTHAIFDSIMMSHPREYRDYKYSDLGFYFLFQIIENATNRSFEDYVVDHFYKPMGLNTMGFLPRKKFKKERIVPTEKDEYLRYQVLQGDVHDPGAAMLGGVSGHAGLFSNAVDLAHLMQMFLQGGEYLGNKFLQEETIHEFTRCQFPLNLNRRGIGFDKPLLEFVEEGPTCRSASANSFGHSGFTGTYVWADPENDLIYVFLSNRVYPDASNNLISELNIRTNLHQALYDALEKEKNKQLSNLNVSK